MSFRPFCAFFCRPCVISPDEQPCYVPCFPPMRSFVTAARFENRTPHRAQRNHATQAEDARRSGRQAKASGVCHCRSIRQRAARRTACGQDGLASSYRQAHEQARALCQRDTGAFSELLAQATLKLDPCGATHVELRTAHLATLAPAHHPPAFGRRAEATPREPPLLDARFGAPCPYPTPVVLALAPTLSP